MAVFRRRWPGVSYGRGEGWHYVGEAGEPAFENSWVNASGGADLGFRIRENGVVDIQGVVGSGSDFTVFTLPVGYRPSAHVNTSITTYDSGTDSHYAGVLTVLSTGEVRAYRRTAGANYFDVQCMIYAQVFLRPADAP